MKIKISTTFLFFTLATASETNLSLQSKVHSLKPKFLQWTQDFNKVYSNAEEEMKRMLVWIKNHEHIEKHNQQIPAPSFTLDHNAFSDLTNEEYQNINKLGKGNHLPPKDLAIENVSEVTSKKRRLVAEDFDLPKYVNWVEEGAVTPAKNQGRCGSCWSFSAVGSIEGAKFLKDGELVSLSEQMMMDCDQSDYSCEGGIMEGGFFWESKEGGLCSEVDYPYIAMDRNMCWDANCTEVSGTHVKEFTHMDGGDIEELMRSIAIQPTSIAMNAQSMSFQFYSEGVFNSTCGHNLDHGVLAVGYGFDEESGLDYFLVKNSWGPEWGENGFFKISTFQENPGDMGMCGILNNYNTAPILY